MYPVPPAPTFISKTSPGVTETLSDQTNPPPAPPSPPPPAPPPTETIETSVNPGGTIKEYDPTLVYVSYPGGTTPSHKCLLYCHVLYISSVIVRESSS